MKNEECKNARRTDAHWHDAPADGQGADEARLRSGVTALSGRGPGSPAYTTRSRNRPEGGAVSRAGMGEGCSRNSSTSAGRQAPPAHFHQHAHDAAHHLPDEVRPGHAHQHQCAVLPQLDGPQLHLRGHLVGVAVGERPEVVHADEHACRFAHRPHVQLVLHPPDERLGERRAAPCHLVEVTARHRVVTRVEPVWHRLDPQHVDVGSAARRSSPAAAPPDSRASRCRGARPAPARAPPRRCGRSPAGRPARRPSPRSPLAGARPARFARSSAPASRCSGCRRIRSSVGTWASPSRVAYGTDEDDWELRSRRPRPRAAQPGPVEARDRVAVRGDAAVGDGRVSVDGRIVRDPLAAVVPERVSIAIDGQPGVRAEWRLLILNKPRGVVTTPPRSARAPDRLRPGR